MNQIASRAQLRAGFLRWAIVTVPLVLLLGLAAGSLVSAGSDNAWYAALAKPSFTPPDWAFPVAWTLIYVLLGVALAMVLDARGATGRGPAVAAFAVQLVLNLAWMPLFFGAHRVSAALVLILVLLALVLLTTWLFARIRPRAALLFAPYIAWLALATALTWQIDRLNPDAEALVPGGGSAQMTL
ncbi:TspO/MBR family protein [Sphingomonas sp. ac-8]|uniref:TspO/MBR family protein n=1 Tax=Sphingomonas sp. ac-8 TaxID=3242977 RepID=UPI003A803F7F